MFRSSLAFIALAATTALASPLNATSPISDTPGKSNATLVDNKGVISVFWHVITANETREGGNLPLPLLHDQIKDLNHLYRDTGFSFVLAEYGYHQNRDWFHEIDPTRTQMHEWQTKTPITPKEKAQGMDAKEIYDLNVWTIDFEHPLMQGDSPFPMEGGIDRNDGIVLDYAAVRPGAIVLAHEVGHWMGLLHTFDSDCENEGDGLTDTVMQMTPDPALITSCSPRVACDGTTFLPNNIMDYAGDECATEFTPQQRALMRETVAKLRHFKPGPVFN
ncbi:hypothetical protein HGRIS_010797 [Hohenbuehelia grisea]|uniref:Peptidase M43 pregnancy-associated plasma-A domain-containing protein n=1 Tax=Hohenbuehelia grisea TaxID=104357 RepID=A0ABR3IXZ3_9AGAR